MCRAGGPGVLAHDAAGIAASAAGRLYGSRRFAFTEAVVVIPPGGAPDLSGCSVNCPVVISPLALASRGARRGASERRYQAMPGDVQRLKLLVEPHPATFCPKRNLYGKQKVRGSKSLSST